MSQNGHHQDIPPGHLGNLTDEQEDKLRQLWAFAFQVLEMYETEDRIYKEKQARGEVDDTPAKAATTTNGGGGWGLFGRKKSSTELTHPKFPNCAAEMQRLVPADEPNREELLRLAIEALDVYTPETGRALIVESVKHEHPDTLALRFLRARKWNLMRAVVMLAKSLRWRMEVGKVDRVLMRQGEGHALEHEVHGAAGSKEKTLGKDFLNQMRWAKGFLHGWDRDGRPVNYIRAARHRASDQSTEALEQFTVYCIELARLSLQAPQEMGTIVFDLTGFSLSNMDYVPVKFLVQCFEANYPESLGCILVHNAPWGFGGVYRIIERWLDPVVASKVHFTNGPDEISKYIAPEQLVSDLGGTNPWEYEYVPPVDGENAKMDDHATRDELLARRRDLVAAFEGKTREWIAAEAPADRERVKKERDELATQLADNFWDLDPYLRARSLYDRLGVFQGRGKVDWSAAKRTQDELKAKAK
ncbi:CRAL/TRIO domain protein [Cordyceps fumosorosea ARSEF 2679]|uniref:CRAL/TRIO domain protein n=1 Tax=Cordyceps fumosorosea (strain ARSEF 2679) TaxID=1081104 RepID=A0A167NDX1_CORFA|nr:CRAL/TRIO domain protein [Cordyceps fumosorosea ARSEF 2679]OAA55449.1 CRAL/TRIO domain protein [Cordyceps fumosorosea ARSEF 2679]